MIISSTGSVDPATKASLNDTGDFLAIRCEWWSDKLVATEMSVKVTGDLKQSLRAIVRGWDRDDEAIDRAAEIDPCPFYAAMTLDGYLRCRLAYGHDGPHVPDSDRPLVPFRHDHPAWCLVRDCQIDHDRTPGV